MAKLISILSLLLLMPISSSCDALPIDSPSIDSSTKELYFIPNAVSRSPNIVELRTIKKWEGDQSQNIKFKATKAPWVINSGYTRTSQLSSIFELFVGQATDIPNIEKMQNTATLSDGSVIGLIEDSGIFIIRVKASGIKWWVKIGVE